MVKTEVQKDEARLKRRRSARRFRVIVSVVTIIALVIFIYAIREQIVDTIQNLDDINLWVIALMPLIQLINYHSYTSMYQRMFAYFGEKLSYWNLFRIQLELNFVNNVFPSGGVSGISYFGLRFRKYGVSAGRATLVQVMKFGLLFVSFQIMLIIGVLILAFSDQAGGLLLVIAGSISTLLLVFTAGLAFILGSRQRINSFFTVITKLINKIIHKFRRGNPETIQINRVHKLFNDLHDSYKLIKSDWSSLKRPLLFAILANFTEILTIYVVYVAFGAYVNPGAIIIAYAVANIAGTISILPGGIGVYEFLMTATLAAAGVPASLSVPVTVTYRILNTIIQLPPGYYFYNKALHERQDEDDD